MEAPERNADDAEEEKMRVNLVLLPRMTLMTFMTQTAMRDTRSRLTRTKSILVNTCVSSETLKPPTIYSTSLKLMKRTAMTPSDPWSKARMVWSLTDHPIELDPLVAIVTDLASFYLLDTTMNS